VEWRTCSCGQKTSEVRWGSHYPITCNIVALYRRLCGALLLLYFRLKLVPARQSSRSEAILDLPAFPGGSYNVVFATSFMLTLLDWTTREASVTALPVRLA
jgi:hypothetical protein